MRYKLLVGVDNDDVFTDKVNDYIEHGWELYGYTTVTDDDGVLIYAQAMISKVQNDT